MHVPLTGALVGTACPFGVFGVHTPAWVHQSAATQSVSTVQVVPHAPVAVPQTGPAWLAVQSEFEVHLPHVPAAAQNGLAVVGQGSVAFDPLSPVHAAHASFVGSHTGVAPAHAAASVVVHCTQVAVAALQTGVGAAQLVSFAHASHVPESVPVATHVVETQARVATLATQPPPGTGWPLALFGWQTPASARSLHQLPASHSGSWKQTAPQAPVVVLQYGLAANGHGLDAVEPLSPLHGAHAPALEQTG